MSQSTNIPELLVRWWNFTDASLWGRAHLATHSPAKPAEESLTPNTGVLGLHALLSTPLDDEPEKGNSSVKSLRGPSDDVLRLKPLLDIWLDAEFAPEDFDAFQNELEKPTTVFDVVLESGKVFRGDLAVLCSIRMASLLMKRPNPLFFYPADTGLDSLGPARYLMFDPRFLLPTPSAKDYRGQMAAVDHIVMSTKQCFLFGNYLPELVGKIVLDGASLSEAHRRALHAGKDNSASGDLPHPVAALAPERTSAPAVRYFLLALAHVLKTIFSGSLRYGNRQHVIIARLVGPRSAKNILGRLEYMELRKLSHRGMVTK